MIAPDGNFLHWGGTGLPLHFGHANGFPPGTYRELLGTLAGRFRVGSMEARAMWPGADPAGLADWSPLVQDLRDTLQARGFRGGVGAGHSLGSVCSLMAAVQDPGLFRALVLVDPVFFTGFRSWFWERLRHHGWVERTPIVAGAVRRRDRFADPAAARAGWQDKALFRAFTPGSFDAYVQSAVVPDGAGAWTLHYPKAWEAAIFRATPAQAWDWLARSPVPTLVVRGAHSDTLTRPAIAKCRKVLKNIRIVEVPGTGHMVPLERPDAVAGAVTAFLDEVL